MAHNSKNCDKIKIIFTKFSKQLSKSISLQKYKEKVVNFLKEMHLDCLKCLKPCIGVGWFGAGNGIGGPHRGVHQRPVPRIRPAIRSKGKPPFIKYDLR